MRWANSKVPASTLPAAWCICLRWASVLSWKFSCIFIRYIPESGRYIYLSLLLLIYSIQDCSVVSHSLEQWIAHSSSTSPSPGLLMMWSLLFNWDISWEPSWATSWTQPWFPQRLWQISVVLRYCPARDMQLWTGEKDARADAWQWAWLFDGISGAGCWFGRGLIWSRLPVVRISLCVSVN